MFCANCGTKCKPDSNFCYKCGFKLGDAVVPATGDSAPASDQDGVQEETEEPPDKAEAEKPPPKKETGKPPAKAAAKKPRKKAAQKKPPDKEEVEEESKEEAAASPNAKIKNLINSIGIPSSHRSGMRQKDQYLYEEFLIVVTSGDNVKASFISADDVNCTAIQGGKTPNRSDKTITIPLEDITNVY